MPILETKNLTIGYVDKHKQLAVLNDINLQLNKGELVTLVGANGTGKSTLLRTLAGTLHPINGSVLLNGTDISTISRTKLSKQLAIVNTDRTDSGGLLVEELVELGRQPYTGYFGRLSNEDHKIVEKAMIDAGIYKKKDSYVADLSDGERQKAMIARALAQTTPIIFLDEPTAFLDIASKIETMTLLLNLAHDLGKSILLSSHDIAQAVALSDRLWIICENGKIEQGITEKLILDGTMNNVFRSEHIEFDSLTGSFVPLPDFKTSIRVTTHNQNRMRWIENLLNRHKIKIDNTQIGIPHLEIMEDGKMLFSTATSAAPMEISWDTLVSHLQNI